MEPEEKQGLKAGQRNVNEKLGMGSRTEGWRDNEGCKNNNREGGMGSSTVGWRKRGMGCGAEKWRKKIQ